MSDIRLFDGDTGTWHTIPTLSFHIDHNAHPVHSIGGATVMVRGRMTSEFEAVYTDELASLMRQSEVEVEVELTGNTVYRGKGMLGEVNANAPDEPMIATVQVHSLSEEVTQQPPPIVAPPMPDADPVIDHGWTDTLDELAGYDDEGV